MKIKGVILIWLALTLVLPPLSARATASSTAGDAVPNFAESGTCGPFGTRGSLSETNTIGDRVYGPFADFFGRSRSQVLSSTIQWTEPSGRTFRVHTRSLPAFQQARANIIASGAGYRVSADAAWVWRNIAASRQMSQHAVGNAIDINPAQNRFDPVNLITNMPSSYVAAWEAAGFCWGGVWRFAKDAMHFSWEGPASTAGTTPRLAPFPPLTTQATFTTGLQLGSVGVPGGAALLAMSDRRRSGVDDLYAVVASGGKWQIQVTGAVSDFRTVGVRRVSGAAANGVPVLADADGDGLADLWVFSGSGVIRADVYSDSTRFRSVGKTFTSGASWGPGTEIGLAVFDSADWLPDLYVINRSSGRVDIYSSSSGYQQRIHTSTLPVTVGGDQIVLADRGSPTDGTADIWLVAPGSAARVRMVKYTTAAGYAGGVETVTTGMTVPSGAVVLPGDYDGDGRVDLHVVAGGRISVWLGGVPDRPTASLHRWFTPDGPVTFDAGPVCPGSCDSVGHVDPSGAWRLAREAAWGPEEANFYYGNPGDEPFMGDWDCDGDDTPGLYRRSNGFVYLRNTNTQGNANIRFYFGNPGDIPIAGDFDGDGCDTVSIYRPSQGRFYIINRLGSADAGLGAADYSFLFGNPGDKPFTGDFNGDDIDTIGLHRESTGLVYLRNTNSTGVAHTQFIYGNPGDYLLAGDWDGDGDDTPVIFRPTEGNWYIRLTNTAGWANHVIPFGVADRGLVPVVGNTDLSPQTLSSQCASCVLDPSEGG